MKTGKGYRFLFRYPHKRLKSETLCKVNGAVGIELLGCTSGLPKCGVIVGQYWSGKEPTDKQYDCNIDSMLNVPTITKEDWRILRQAACSLSDEVQMPKRPRQTRQQVDVIDSYNQAYSIHDQLRELGYIPNREGSRYTRPGGKSESVVVFDNVSWHYSSNDNLATDGKPRDPFDIFAKMEHGGDYKAAVKAAAKELGIRYQTKQGTNEERKPSQGQVAKEFWLHYEKGLAWDENGSTWMRYQDNYWQPFKRTKCKDLSGSTLKRITAWTTAQVR